MNLIYSPKGPAEEYAPLACNYYCFCTHGCRYCYRLPFVSAQKFHQTSVPKKDAIDRLRATIEKLQFVVYGEGDYLDRFLAKVEELKLSDCVSYRGHVSLETIAREIPSADIGLIPNIRSPFTELNLPTRIFEYLAVGRPVIAPRTKGILDYFDDKSLFLFEPGEVQSLVECISAVYSDHKRLEQVYVAGGKIYQNYRWELQSKHFTQIVHNILAE